MVLKVVYGEMAAGGIKRDWVSRLSGAKRRYHNTRLKGLNGMIDGKWVMLPNSMFQNICAYHNINSKTLFILKPKITWNNSVVQSPSIFSCVAN